MSVGFDSFPISMPGTGASRDEASRNPLNGAHPPACRDHRPLVGIVRVIGPHQILCSVQDNTPLVATYRFRANQLKICTGVAALRPKRGDSPSQEALRQP